MSPAPWTAALILDIAVTAHVAYSHEDHETAYGPDGVRGLADYRRLWLACHGVTTTDVFESRIQNCPRVVGRGWDLTAVAL
jgi:hypothetical protein